MTKAFCKILHRGKQCVKMNDRLEQSFPIKSSGNIEQKKRKFSTVNGEKNPVMSKTGLVDHVDEIYVDEKEDCYEPFFVWPIPPASEAYQQQDSLPTENENTVKLQVPDEFRVSSQPGCRFHNFKGDTRPDSSDAGTIWDKMYGDGVDWREFVEGASNESNFFASHAGISIETGCGITHNTWNTSSSQREVLKSDNADTSVPRDLLTKCWFRALDVASSSLPVKVGNYDSIQCLSDIEGASYDDDAHNDDDGDSSVDLEMRCKEQNLTWRDMMNKLPVDKESNRPSYKCGLCNLVQSFANEREISQHLFSMEATPSCAEKVIDFLRERQSKKINKILLRETESIIDAILHGVFCRAKENIQGENKGEIILGWKDMLSLMDEISVGASTVSVIPKISSPSRISTLPATANINPFLLPISLNDESLNAIALRLVDRYEKIG